MLKIQFLGASGTVTGSKYSVTYGEQHILIDCGMFQGDDSTSRHNWDRWPIEPRLYSAMLLTHAHIDHSGSIPRFVGDGFAGDIFCTEPTLDLCHLMLPDSAKIQSYSADEEAPAYYDQEDVADSLALMEPMPYYRQFQVIKGCKATFFDAGHILGSAWIELEFAPLPGWEKQRAVRVVFSGDLGRGKSPLLAAPDVPEHADYLILESTYGNRLHTSTPPTEMLSEAVQATRRDRSSLVIPAFAVQRSQDLAYLFEEMLHYREIDKVSLFVDSPMAAKATRVYEEHPRYLGNKARARLEGSGQLLRYPYLRVCETGAQSRSIHDFSAPRAIVSASGMCEGGRVLHHLMRHLPDPRARILLAGFQCEGTRGWQLQQGASEIEIDGQKIQVRAQVETLDGLSGHADYAEIEDWLSGLDAPPQQTFLVHGDEDALEAQRARLSARPDWHVTVPAHREEFVLIS